MNTTIFYSWQSDLHNSTNRGFIEQALEQAAKTIRNDESIKIEPVIDRDTKGIPGSPDIASTIFKKIEQAQIFVCDISLINKGSDKRPTPNPNVLIELGYAIKALGSSRIIMVFNTEYGKIEDLPFDLRLKRVVSYKMTEQTKERAPERKMLQKRLERELTTIFEAEGDNLFNEAQEEPITKQTKSAIENSSKNKIYLVRKFMKWLFNEIDTFSPHYSEDTERDDLLVESLENTKGIVTEFSTLVEIVSSTSDFQAVTEIHQSFSHILTNYNNPRGFSGSFNSTDFDFHKFLGHELFVTFISFLIQDNQWEFLSTILNKGIYIDNRRGEPGIVTFEYISDYIGLLGYRNNRLEMNRASIHADLLNNRHSEGELAQIVPMEQFIEADFFLFLRAGLDWRPWSGIYIGSNAPKFLVKATSLSYAQSLLDPLQLKNIDSLKEILRNRVDELRQIFRRSWGFYPLENFKLNAIGSMQ